MAAAIGGAVDLGIQLSMNGWSLDCVNWTSVAISAGAGALGFGVAGRISAVGWRLFAANAAAGGAIAAGAQATSNVIEGRRPIHGVGSAAAAGAVLGAGGGAVGAAIARRAAPALSRSAAQNLSLAQQADVLNAAAAQGAMGGTRLNIVTPAAEQTANALGNSVGAGLGATLDVPGLPAWP